MMAQISRRIGYLRCEAELVLPAMAEPIRSILQLRGPFIHLAEAGCYPMLDQPLPTVSALPVLFEFWSITQPDTARVVNFRVRYGMGCCDWWADGRANHIVVP
jgi:hypothetical protein